MSYPMDLDDHACAILRLQRSKFGDMDMGQQALVLAEETGEVCRVVVKTEQGIRPDTRGDLGEELADVLMVALGMFAQAGINPDHALRAKMRKLEQRVYTRDVEVTHG